MGRELDAMDMASRDWAKTRRKALGIILPEMMEGKEMLGKTRCTLAQVREDGEGASQGSTINQKFPEVYSGDALVVHRARQLMNPQQRIVHHTHYVYWESSRKSKADFLQITEEVYKASLRALKLFLSGYFAALAHMHVEKHYESIKKNPKVRCFVTVNQKKVEI